MKIISVPPETILDKDQCENETEPQKYDPVIRYVLEISESDPVRQKTRDCFEAVILKLEKSDLQSEKNSGSYSFYAWYQSVRNFFSKPSLSVRDQLDSWETLTRKSKVALSDEIRKSEEWKSALCESKEELGFNGQNMMPTGGTATRLEPRQEQLISQKQWKIQLEQSILSALGQGGAKTWENPQIYGSTFKKKYENKINLTGIDKKDVKVVWDELCVVEQLLGKDSFERMLDECKANDASTADNNKNGMLGTLLAFANAVLYKEGRNKLVLSFDEDAVSDQIKKTLRQEDHSYVPFIVKQIKDDRDTFNTMDERSFFEEKAFLDGYKKYHSIDSDTPLQFDSKETVQLHATNLSTFIIHLFIQRRVTELRNSLDVLPLIQKDTVLRRYLERLGQFLDKYSRKDSGAFLKKCYGFSFLKKNDPFELNMETSIEKLYLAVSGGLDIAQINNLRTQVNKHHKDLDEAINGKKGLDIQGGHLKTLRALKDESDTSKTNYDLYVKSYWLAMRSLLGQDALIKKSFSQETCFFNYIKEELGEDKRYQFRSFPLDNVHIENFSSNRQNGQIHRKQGFFEPAKNKSNLCNLAVNKNRGCSENKIPFLTKDYHFVAVFKKGGKENPFDIGVEIPDFPDLYFGFNCFSCASDFKLGLGGDDGRQTPERKQSYNYLEEPKSDTIYNTFRSRSSDASFLLLDENSKDFSKKENSGKKTKEKKLKKRDGDN